MTMDVKVKTQANSKSKQDVFEKKKFQLPGPQNYDANLLEYVGTSSGLPIFLWQPSEFRNRTDFNHALGVAN